MSSDARLDFILWVTDWVKGHYEDQDWGRRDVMYKKAIVELASKIKEPNVQKEIQRIVK